MKRIIFLWMAATAIVLLSVGNYSTGYAIEALGTGGVADTLNTTGEVDSYDNSSGNPADWHYDYVSGTNVTTVGNTNSGVFTTNSTNVQGVTTNITGTSSVNVNTGSGSVAIGNTSGTTTVNGGTTGINSISTVTINGNSDGSNNSGEGVIINSNGIGAAPYDAVRSSISVLGSGVSINSVSGTTISGGTTAINTTTNITGTTSINTGGTAITNIGNATGATNINAGIAGTTNIGTGAAASTTNIGNSLSTNNIAGTTNINASINSATNINTGTSSSAVMIGNALNITNINSATNNIGVNAFITANNIGTGAAASTNTIGNTQAATTVYSYAGAGYTTLNNANSTLGTGDGGLVQTTATTAAIRASDNSHTLATNSSTGTMAVNGGGGYISYNSEQNTGVNTIGHVVDNKSYTNKINGSLYVDGNVYINGTLDYVSSNSANTTVVGLTTGGSSNLRGASQPVSAGTAIVLKGSAGTQTVVDGNGKLTNVTGTAGESTASLTLTNGLGNTHGIVVTETQTTISGGMRSSALTLNDYGATFSNTVDGSPVQVHGVDDGTAPYDAVNVRQLGAGLAMVAGLAALPQVEQGKNFAFGLGTGGYMSQVSLAGGLSARFLNSIVIKAGCAVVPSYGNIIPIWNAGVQYSF